MKVFQGQRGVAPPQEEVYFRLDGTHVPVEATASPITYQGQPGAVVFIQDITDRKRAEAGLRESNKRLTALFEGAKDSIIIADIDTGIILNVNAAAESLLGRARDQIIGLHQWQLHPPAEVQKYEEMFHRHIARQGGIIEDIEVQRTDGSRVPVQISASIIDLDGGRRVVQGVFRDVSERIRAESEISRRQELLAAISRIQSKFISEVEPKGVFELMHNELLALTGSPSGFMGEILHTAEGQPYLKVWALSNLAWNDAMRELYDQHAAQGMELYNLNTLFGSTIRTGEPVIANDASHDPRRSGLPPGHPALDSFLCLPCYSGGQMTGLVGLANRPGGYDAAMVEFLQPFTTTCGRLIEAAREERLRQQADKALGESEVKYRRLHESMTDAFVRVDMTGRIQESNASYQELLGYSDEEVRRTTYMDITPMKWHVPEAHIIKEQVLRRGHSEVYEKEFRRKDGVIFPVELRTFLIRDDTGEPTGKWAIVRDITERKRAEVELQRLATVVEQASEIIVITDTHGTSQYVNPAFERVSGYARQEAIGQNPRILKSGKHTAEFYQRMWTVLSRGEIWSDRLVNKRKDGSLFEEEATISPIRDAAGRVVNYVAVKRDVSREAELEAQLRQAQKLEAIGQLAGGVAHDFNNLLTVIQMQAELGGLDQILPPDTQEALGEIKRTAERAANLTRQLLLFSRRQVMQPQTLDLNEAVTNVAKMLGRFLGEDIRLHLNLHSQPLWTHADGGMLDQVLMNLSVNARDAMPAGGHLTIETAAETLDAAQARRHPDAVPGRYVSLRVQDAGCGIPPEILPRIFEPFFTTKEVGKGTGLGLATVFGIVKQHRGWIEVHSDPGQGAAFHIYLPAKDATAEVQADTTTRAAPRGGTETILLVEDEPGVRMTTRAILQRHGYRVLEAAAGPEAMSIWSLQKNHIDLLLTDLVLPDGMDGRELGAQLQMQKPKLRIIFMSGYSPELAGRELTLQPGQRFIQKPCSSVQLVETVRRCLDS